MSFEEEYADVLQNIEFAIVTVYRRNNALLDYDVTSAIEALIRIYRGEQSGRPATTPNLDERPQQVFEAARELCEFRLGRGEGDLGGHVGEIKPVSVAEIIDCLKRIEKSVHRWTKQGGRRGYLDFVSQYVV